jgi:hypothetical protein
LNDADSSITRDCYLNKIEPYYIGDHYGLPYNIINGCGCKIESRCYDVILNMVKYSTVMSGNHSFTLTGENGVTLFYKTVHPEAIIGKIDPIPEGRGTTPEIFTKCLLTITE